MTIFRSYSDMGVLQTVPYFASLLGTIDGLNKTFTSSRPLGVTKHDFVLLYNGLILNPNDFDFFYPDTIILKGSAPVPPNDRMEFITFGRVNG